MENSQASQPDGYMYYPPTLPAHLATIYDLKPIAGKPTDEQVKTIHAAIRAVNAEAQTIYRDKYPLSILPRDNIYTPPSLPTHIPIILEPVTGSPSDEQLKAAQDAMRIVESRGSGPLFDSNLSMHLSQHCFNLQFTRYIQDSTLGQFATKSNEFRHARSHIHGSIAEPSVPQNTIRARLEELRGAQPEPAQTTAPVVNLTQSLRPQQTNDEARLSPEITQMGQTISVIKELMGEAKGILENINRVLIATQRNQAVVGKWEDSFYIHCNPVNDQGVTAVESGLPQLRYYYHKRNYNLVGHMNSNQLAGYLKFFNIGADLIEGDDAPRLKAGAEPESEARRLIFKHLGLLY